MPINVAPSKAPMTTSHLCTWAHAVVLCSHGGASQAGRCHFRGSVVSSPLIYRKTLCPSSETSIPCAKCRSFSESRRMVIARSCDIVHLLTLHHIGITTRRGIEHAGAPL